MTEANFDFVGYPGDSIAFMDGAIGRLAHDYQYGEDSSEVIPAETLIVAGTYRGDPVYNTIQILGEYLVGDMAQGSTQTEERPINGEVYLFAEVPEEGALAEINNGHPGSLFQTSRQKKSSRAKDAHTAFCHPESRQYCTVPMTRMMHRVSVK